MVPVNTLLAAASPLPLATLLLLAFSSVSSLAGQMQVRPERGVDAAGLG
jgi:hypothetical protein